MTDMAPGIDERIDGRLDERFMALALALGRRGLGRTWPNPAVGAVVVKDGAIVGRGWTQPGGRPHAEVEALRRAGKQARGATLYVTLEPCSHHGKSPPCTDAIVKARIARVVSAMEDPNPEVAGKGHALLAAAGIGVEVGFGAEAARRDHLGHILRITQRRPMVTLKLAISSDGKAGASGHRPVAITDEPARASVHLMRAQHDAIMVGLGTALADDPALTCRLPGMDDRSPVRVVLDAQLRLPLASLLVSTARETPVWIFGGEEASSMAERFLRDQGVEVFRVVEREGWLDLDRVLATLAERGITRLMVEGGPTVAASLVAADRIDEAVLFRSPNPIGPDGIDALPTMPPLVADGLDNVGRDRVEFFRRPSPPAA